MRTLIAILVLFPSLAQADKRFAPVDLTVDLKAIPANEQRVLGKLVRASRFMDALFLRQVWAGNETMLLELAKARSPHLDEFLVNKGPWSRLDKNAPFVPGAPPKPPQGSFYPADATKAQLAEWMKKLPEKEHEQAAGFFTTVRRATDGRFVIVPYSLEYQPELGEVARLLREAATLTKIPTLKDFLAKRASGFLANDYHESDLAWMKLDSAIEPTIGPYEVYEDDWFNYKAAFEAFIAVRDDAESKKLARFASELQDIENHLPFRLEDGPAMRNPKIGALAPIRVVNELFCAGDANHGVQTAAYNLPNDERIEKEVGTKRVMLKNVQEAKFKSVLVPIAAIALTEDQQKQIGFDAFFTHILMHELMHGLGPHTVGGKPVRAALENTYSAIEEAKADILGLWAMQYLIDKSALPKELEKTLYTTYLATAFRSIRFGVTEAHGKGQALQLNFLVDQGGVKVDANGRFAVEPSKIKAGVTALAAELLTLEGKGDRARAVALLSKLGVVRPEVQKILEKLKDVPVDIAPRFVTADSLP
jgi:hypothetical protein